MVLGRCGRDFVRTAGAELEENEKQIKHQIIMTLNISIEYRTNWGEEIVLCLAGKRYPLTYVAEGLWKG